MKSKSTFRYKAGQYYYKHWNGRYGIWLCNSVSATGSMSSHITNVWNKEEATSEVYRLNGWNKKSSS